MKNPNQKITLLVDGPNFAGTTHALGFQADFKALRDHFEEQGKLIHCRYFTLIDPSDESDHSRRLHDYLQYNGWSVEARKTGSYATRDGRLRPKGSCIIDLTLHAIKVAPSTDHIIICSGNRDLAPVVSHLQEMGCKVTIASTMITEKYVVADNLRRRADSFLELASIQEIICRIPTEAETA